MLSRLVTYFRSHHVALLALFVALGGTSYAALKLPGNSVGTKQLKSRAVTLAKIDPATRKALRAQAGEARVGPAGPLGAAGPGGAPGAEGGRGGGRPQGGGGAGGAPGGGGRQGGGGAGRGGGRRG